MRTSVGMADGSLAEQHDAGERAILDDLVGSHENRLRDRQADCFGGPEVYDKLELGGLLDRQVGRFGAFEDWLSRTGARILRASSGSREWGRQASRRNQFLGEVWVNERG
jgi:hypothetical protein